MKSEVYNCDCVEYMRTLPDKAFQLAIADPPYGLDPSASETWSEKSALKNRAWANGKIGETWDKAPDKVFFDELMRVCENVIIWGGNYFPLPPARCIVCWDKKADVIHPVFTTMMPRSIDRNKLETILLGMAQRQANTHIRQYMPHGKERRPKMFRMPV